MASEEKVKRYLAYWFQLGKKVLLQNGDAILPDPIVMGDSYSQDFERCWQIILDQKNRDCYLEGTSQTIAELLSPRWEIISCSRCEMPVPMIDLGQQSNLCPCNDLSDWPNTELPTPRDPVKTQDKLQSLASKLRNIKI